MLNVRDFGAAGNCMADDTKAIQRAIDTAAEKHETIFFPPGIYICADLKLRDNVGLKGDPVWGSSQVAGAVLKVRDRDANCVLDLSVRRGVTIDGLCIWGGGTHAHHRDYDNHDSLGRRIHGIMSAPEKKRPGGEEDSLRISRCLFLGFSGDGIHARGFWYWSIRGCAFHGNKSHGIWFAGAQGQITGCWFAGNHGAGISSDEGSGSVSVTQSRFETCRQGGIVLASAYDWSITGCSFADNGGPGIKATPAERAAGARGIKGLTITGNLFGPCGVDCLGGTPEGEDRTTIRLESCKKIAVSGNTIEASVHAITIGNLQQAAITGNVLTGGTEEQLILNHGEHENGVILESNVMACPAASTKFPMDEIELPLLTQDGSATAELRNWAPFSIFHGDQSLGDVRLAADGPALAVLATVHHSGVRNEDPSWEATGIEIFAASENSPADELAQLIISPAGPEECVVQLNINGKQQDVPEIDIKVAPLDGGYCLFGRVPFDALRLPADVKCFRLDCVIRSSPRRYLRQASLSGVPDAHRNNKGYIRVAVK